MFVDSATFFTSNHKFIHLTILLKTSSEGKSSKMSIAFIVWQLVICNTWIILVVRLKGCSTQFLFPLDVVGHHSGNFKDCVDACTKLLWQILAKSWGNMKRHGRKHVLSGVCYYRFHKYQLPPSRDHWFAGFQISNENGWILWKAGL